jgi:adenylate kinase family enzyme
MPHKAMIDKDIRVVILGNSASGKSTLARQLAKRFSIARLDLDTLAWLPMGSLAKELQRVPLAESMVGINAFIQTKKNWLIEGCYSDLLEQVLPVATQLVFMDLPITRCLENARNRPCKSDEYASLAVRDAQLELLMHCIVQYEIRKDAFSYSAHQRLFTTFEQAKVRLTENQQNLAFLQMINF